MNLTLENDKNNADRSPHAPVISPFPRLLLWIKWHSTTLNELRKIQLSWNKQKVISFLWKTFGISNWYKQEFLGRMEVLPTPSDKIEDFLNFVWESFGESYLVNVKPSPSHPDFFLMNSRLQQQLFWIENMKRLEPVLLDCIRIWEHICRVGNDGHKSDFLRDFFGIMDNWKTFIWKCEVFDGIRSRDMCISLSGHVKEITLEEKEMFGYDETELARFYSILKHEWWWGFSEASTGRMCVLWPSSSFDV